MKLKSTNWYYLAGLLPVTILNFGLGIYLARNNWWIRYLLIFLCIAICIGIFKKFKNIPHSEASYGVLEKTDINLPVDYDIEIFSSKAMSKFEFMNRIVEVYSSMFNKNNAIKVIINPEMMKRYGKNFIEVAALREIRKYETGVSYKSFLYLIVPIEIIISFILSAFVFQKKFVDIMGFFFSNIAFPFLMLLCLALIFYLWNKYISKKDIELDRYLLKYFSVSDIERYITIVEDMNQKEEKENSRKFSQHYAMERIKKLKN